MPLTIFFSSPGTYTIEDDGIRGNNTSVVKDSSGTVLFPFVHPGDTIDFIAETPGITFIFNTADSFGTANVNVGSLTNADLCPDVISVRSMRTDAFITFASRGTIIEGGSDAAADLIAAGLILQAVNGIGTPSNALETQVTFIEAETTTGGINIANFGSVQVGGLTPDLTGFSVATSGDLRFSTTGFILLADGSGSSSVHGGDTSGNVILTALGPDSDIFSNINQKVISVAGGGITLTAGRDVIFGTSGTNFDNDLLATGPITINAGRDFQLDGTSDVRTGAFGGVVGGAITINAGRNINLSNLTGGLQTIQAFDGNIVLNTGPGGVFFELAAFPGAVQTTDDIFLTADNVQINSGGLNTTGIGAVTIRPVTAGRPIDLGNPLDPPGALALSDDEFDLLFTLNVNIGSATTGNVEFTAPLSPFIVDNLTVQSGSDIVFGSTLALPRTLTLRAGDDLYFAPTASFSSTNEGFTAFVDNAQDDLSIGGLGTLAGALSVNTDIRLEGNLDRDQLAGSSADDILMGNGGNDFLFGNGGNDQLNGGLGADNTNGGLGDDVHFVDNAADIVFEAVGEGTDTVQSSISFALGAEFENLTLTGTANLSGTGNGLVNILRGNVGDNLLNGGAGADEMRGGAGDDIYIVDNVGDTAVEGSGNGTDEVRSSATFTLGAQVEALTLTGTGNINGTGNGQANVLVGNVGNNQLSGGTGADEMRGGAGNDVYIVDNTGDAVVEGSGNGTDRVESAITYTLGANVENLTLTGTAGINGTGNGLDNVVRGNTGNNQLNGAAGADEMRGGAGNDTYTVDNVGDLVIEANGNGTDTVNSTVTFTIQVYADNLNLLGAAAIDGTGNKLANLLNGNGAANTIRGEDGDDTIAGGGGADQIHGGDDNDQLTGGAGSDGFRFDTALNGVDNVDDILDFSVTDDTIFIDRAIFAAIGANGTLGAARFRAGTAALDADDAIIYDAATGNIFYDADGTGAIAQILFATVDPGLALTNADFFAYV